jgi:hypothetical protein
LKVLGRLGRTTSIVCELPSDRVQGVGLQVDLFEQSPKLVVFNNMLKRETRFGIDLAYPKFALQSLLNGALLSFGDLKD